MLIKTYCGDCFAIYTNIECCTAETNRILWINYISIFKSIQFRKFENKLISEII